MTFDNFIKEYAKRGLIKKQDKNLKAVENLISRAYKEIKVAEANIRIDEGIAFTIAYTAMLHTGRALILFKGTGRMMVTSIKLSLILLQLYLANIIKLLYSVLIRCEEKEIPLPMKPIFPFQKMMFVTALNLPATLSRLYGN